MVCKKNWPGLGRTVVTNLRHFQCVDCPYEAKHALVSVESISSGGGILCERRTNVSKVKNKQHSAQNDFMFFQRESSFLARIKLPYPCRVPLTISSPSNP